MPRYADDAKEQVRDAVDFADLVGSRVELQRSGVNQLKGLCPFHDERTPSFGINPVDKVYYFALNAAVGTGGICDQCVTSPGLIPRASQSLKKTTNATSCACTMSAKRTTPRFATRWRKSA